MRILKWILLSALLCATTSPQLSRAREANSAPQVEVPVARFKLDNGLTVLVHSDHSVPLVHVGVWYHVGSKNEPAGRAGFAHLFEHLMFNGSENADDEFFNVTRALGATDQNGTTDVDRTNYFQTVPVGSLDAMLWLESDRMGHLLGAITQEKLDEQRSVVKNEKRQGENRPYAVASRLITRATHPYGHPYAHSTIGEMGDLDAASLDDVRDWFREFYGPSNAVLVLAGDVTAETGLEKAKKYFGGLAPGQPLAQPVSWVVRWPGSIREVAYDRVAQPRLYRVWNVSEYSAADTDNLQLLAEVLAGDKLSRLYKRLVKEEKIATDVGASVWNRQLGGQFTVSVGLVPEGDLSRVERIANEELQKLIGDGPTDAELARIRARTSAAFVRSLERLTSRASLIADSEIFGGAPDAWRMGYERFMSASAGDIRESGERWLTDSDYVLHILPFEAREPSVTDVDRKAMPAREDLKHARFAAVESATLKNGLRVSLAPRSSVPLVQFDFLLATGVDPDAQRNPAIGPIAMLVLTEGSEGRSGEVIQEELAGLGGTISAAGGSEFSQISMSVLKENVDRALGIYADVILSPTFGGAEVLRAKEKAAVAISAVEQDPSRVAGRISARVAFGSDHPYGRVVRKEDVLAIAPIELSEFHRRWFHPHNAVLVVTGDTSLAEILPTLEKVFGQWEPQSSLTPMAVDLPVLERPGIYLVDSPGASQTVIRSIRGAPKRNAADDVAQELMNDVVGGTFMSRLNLRLREEKGWAYGASSGFTSTRGTRLFIAGASVDARYTIEAMIEMDGVLHGMVSSDPVSAVELNSAREEKVMGLTSAWSSIGGIASYILDPYRFDLDPNYYVDYADRLNAVTPDAVNVEARAILAGPSRWVVVGDRRQLESSLRALNWGPVMLVDGNGDSIKE